MPSDKPMIAVRLDPKLYADVQKLAKRDGRSAANWVQYAIRMMVHERLAGKAAP
jgi:hypothetical protein